MTTKYTLYKNGDFSMLEKEVRSAREGGHVTITISAAHVKGSDYVGVRVSIHDWHGLDDRHGFFEAKSVKAGWDMFRQFVNLYRIEG